MMLIEKATSAKTRNKPLPSIRQAPSVITATLWELVVCISALQHKPLPVGAAQRRDRQLAGIVVGVNGLLRAVLIDQLPKIALLIEQSHAGHRHAQIAGGLELIAGHVAQSTRIDRQRLAQHEFHAEIGDTAQLRLRMGLLKPRGRLRRVPPGLYQTINFFAESRIG